LLRENIVLKFDFATVADRMAIEAALVRYTHGVDRIDVAMIKSAFWPEAIDDHGMYVGNAHDFADFLGQTLSPGAAMTHVLTNIHIELDGAKAKVESYVTATNVLPPDRGSFRYVLAGRYLDRFERREGEWRIASRTLVVDWLDVPEEAALVRANHSKITRRGKPAPYDSWYTEV
jgi:hypothetical protein